MNLLDRILGRHVEARLSVDEYAELFAFNGTQYAVTSTAGRSDVEASDDGFALRVQTAYKSNGVVFACELARLLIFSEARFQWQRLVNGRPGDLFGTTDLEVLERPWPNGTTGELLSRMEQDSSFAGNAYVWRDGDRLRRLRPDWVSIVLDAPPAEAIRANVIGYRWQPPGTDPQFLTVGEVAHWSPIPDPEAEFRGMSWLTPVIREVASDKAATKHKHMFFTNGASPQLAVSFKETVTEAQFKAFMKAMNDAHQGVDQAYKTLYLGGGADVTVVGKDLRQLDFKASQGAGETRIAAAAGVHPVIVGLSEGLQGSSLNAGNFASARRRFADGTIRPLWRSAAAALETIVPPPAGVRLWYDDRDIPFLREDAKDSAEIESTKAQTIARLVDAGFEADAVVNAVMAEDLAQLAGSHSGLFSVQLQPPGANASNGNGGGRSKRIVRDRDGLIVGVEEA